MVEEIRVSESGNRCQNQSPLSKAKIHEELEKTGAILARIKKSDWRAVDIRLQEK